MAASIAKLGIRALNTRHITIKAARLNSRQLATMSKSLDKVSDVDIDGHGKFKYILIKVQESASKENKFIVRGYARAQWHNDIFEEVSSQVNEIPGLTADCVGGGRIEHDPDQKTISVYGYSQGYGKADHEVSVKLLKKKYPDYTITCSDDGY